ncbi:MAG: hypothetical protein EBU90_03360 [Proteobacteria bacterium]|nr:hypothetical protein [Pseudomonadota bacterium]NBP13365.1 hypothetical protein [bacterium]
MIDNVYVIHYTKLTERKKSINAFANEFNCPVHFVEKCDREELTPQTVQGVYEPDPVRFESKIAPLWDKNAHRFRHLTPGEISVAIKQLLAVKSIADSGKCGLILEDDALPIQENFLPSINRVLEHLPNDWDVVFIGEGCGVQEINRKINDNKLEVVNGVCKAKHPATNCAEAYIIKPEVAKQIYKTALPFQLAYDWELAHTIYILNLNAYWAVPPIFTQGSKNGTFVSALR